MRDNHEGLPEILDAYERDSHFGGVAQVILGREPYAFEFGVDEAGYRSLRKVLQLRPFGTTDLGRYRYFFVPTVRRLGPESNRVEFSVRIEQGREGREFPVEGPVSLASHLMWFFELRRPEDASQLRRVEARPEV